MRCLAVIVGVLVICWCHGRVCNNTDVRSSIRNLEKLRNCTIIMGWLKLVLLNKRDEPQDVNNFVFPDLVEIVDYMIVFNVYELRSLGKMFPNLRVIRGRKKFMYGYALIVEMALDLEEIGFTNLVYLGGNVHVKDCHLVCHVTTVNWKALGGNELTVGNTNNECGEPCPTRCKDFCWNNTVCQNFDEKFCKGFDDDGKCVESCPNDKLTNYDAMRCWTHEECTSAVNGSFWVNNRICMGHCPFGYVEAKNVEGGCVPIDENHKLVCDGRQVSDLYELMLLEKCTHINKSLDILEINTTELASHLENYLGYIVSISGHLTISKSKAITSLKFLRRLREIKGEELIDQNAVHIFENNNLQELWDFDDNFNLTILRGSILFHNNPTLCVPKIEEFEIKTKTTMDRAHIFTNGFQGCNEKLIDITFIQINPTNVTLEWKKEKQFAQNTTILGYTIYYMQDKGQLITTMELDTCGSNSWDDIYVTKEAAQLKKLEPFTKYQYYIKIYTTTEQMIQTPVYYFVTASSKPSKPRDVIVISSTPNSITLQWKPPAHYNGNFTHYKIESQLQEEYQMILHQRNFCKFPYKEVKLSPATLNVTKNDCACLEEPEPEIDQFNEILGMESNAYFSTEVPGSFYQIHNVFNTKVPANSTSFVFRDLEYFSMYIFYVSACNSNKSGEVCGDFEIVSQRTQRNPSVDLVRDLTINVGTSIVSISWTNPLKPNSILVAYQIEYRRRDADHSKTKLLCTTVNEFEKNHKFDLFNLTPAVYSLRVQAVSLNGPGIYTKWHDFEIKSNWIGLKLVLPVVLVLAGFLAFLVGFVWWYRRKYKMNNHLITSINPDYAGTIYVEDQWEIDRSDIEILRELGQGSFGMVYEGRIKSKHYPCAIKTINEHSDNTNRIEFLNEGAVMKSFSDAHHVIKLLGIVSRGQPPLVIMELMERGDLKSYLRRCREPSQNLTTNEMYRMAAEIADGMAYLSAKKFVHRDLATRNCMVSADRTVKIGDFGMARDVYETDYYRKETVGLLPVRWMAPESLADGVFTTDSDVWSYGIVLWEMATLAEQPYQGYSNEEVFRFVKGGGTLERPIECSDFMFEVMEACWNWRPNSRPTFSDIVNRFVSHVGEDFRLVAFCFSRQGLELALHISPRVYNPPAMLPVTTEELFGRYDPVEEQVNLFVSDRTRPYPNQRKTNSYQIRPTGSPGSTLSFISD